MKYPNDPDKFMASEVELHEEIQELHTVAASPELYSIIVDTKAVNSILGRFDISWTAGATTITYSNQYYRQYLCYSFIVITTTTTDRKHMSLLPSHYLSS